jgi:hypothetical protein
LILVEADKYILIFYFTDDMDNIQFWIYIIFAIIYFIAKNARKKPNKKAPSDSNRRGGQQQTQRPQPQSFEDLLEEITGRKSLKEEPVVIDEADEINQETEERYLAPKPWQEKEEEIRRRNEIEREGNNRRFADDESRRIYEESIRRAEGANIDYRPDESYSDKKVLRETAEDIEENAFVTDINNMLSNSDSAKKAVILSEILNRKY